MNPPLDSIIRAARVAAFVITLSVVTAAGDGIAQPFAWSEYGSSLDGLCRVPRSGGAVVQFTGVVVFADATLEQVHASFPSEWMGKPRLHVGLGLRPPGLRLSFEQRVGVALLSIYNLPPERVVFDPDISSPVEVDSVHVTWYPVQGEPYSGDRSWFGPVCFFEIATAEGVMVTGEATVNVVAIYAAPGDTVEVWGTEVGIPDLALRDTRRSVPIAVEPSTWGSIKASFR